MHNPEEDSPSPSPKWLSLSSESRLEWLNSFLMGVSKFEKIKVVSTHENGQVFISMEEALPAASRGTLLLDLEEILKSNVDKSLNIWVLPIGDKNSLRKLRGITIKAFQD